MSDAMWEDERDIPDAPRWVNHHEAMTYRDAASVYEGGCDSGAWMPAVTYWQALETMAEFGDEVLDFLVNNWGGLPPVNNDMSWASMACLYLSRATECFVSSIVHSYEPEEV